MLVQLVCYSRAFVRFRASEFISHLLGLWDLVFSRLLIVMMSGVLLNLSHNAIDERIFSYVK
jgi:hypothetical protein